MTRKLISLLIVLTLCFSLVCSVSVNASTIDFVVDEVGYLADAERELVNDQAAAIYEAYGFGVFYVYTTADELESYDVNQLVSGIEDYYVMIENDSSWYSFLGGIAEDYIDLSTEEYLREVYDAADTYVGGVSDMIDATINCLPLDSGDYAEDALIVTGCFVYDQADLLPGEAEAALEQKLMVLSDTYDAQIVVYTVSSVEGGDVDRYDDYLYDTMGFGYGANHDGVMLLVCMNPRECRILSNGFAGEAIDNGDIEDILDVIVPDLSDGDYAESFNAFADQCEYYLDGYVNGYPFRFGKSLLIALVVGVLVGLIVTSVLKGQLKSVRKQDQANVYLKQGSLNITAQSDIFLYRNVSRSKKSSSSGSSGGSSRSSGGRSF